MKLFILKINIKKLNELDISQRYEALYLAVCLMAGETRKNTTNKYRIELDEN